MTRKSLTGTALVLLSLLTAPAQAIPVFETFDTETADATDGSYPDFTLNVGSASVSGGVLRIGLGNFMQRFTTPGDVGSLTASGQIRSAPFDGGWHVGMEFGNRSFTFNPGFPGGEFLILDLLTIPEVALAGPIDMGFTPSTTTFHTMELSWNESLNHLSIIVTDGDGAASPFQLLWTPAASFDPTGRIGFVYFNGGGDGGIAEFDNLTIVPEPSTAFLLASGFLLLAARRRRREKWEESWRR